MKAVRRFKRKLRTLKVRNIGLVRELVAMQARYNRLAARTVPAGAKK